MAWESWEMRRWWIDKKNECSHSEFVNPCAKHLSNQTRGDWLEGCVPHDDLGSSKCLRKCNCFSMFGNADVGEKACKAVGEWTSRFTQRLPTEQQSAVMDWMWHTNDPNDKKQCWHGKQVFKLPSYSTNSLTTTKSHCTQLTISCMPSCHSRDSGLLEGCMGHRSGTCNSKMWCWRVAMPAMRARQKPSLMNVVRGESLSWTQWKAVALSVQRGWSDLLLVALSWEAKMLMLLTHLLF